MLPFRLTFEPGVSLYEQVVYAAKKAIVSGKLKPGEPFPSVRALSSGLKINQNTAHKVIGHLLTQGILEVRPGIGTVVAERMGTSAAERSNLLKRELEQLAVEAKKLGLNLEQLITALIDHWRRLEGGNYGRDTPDGPIIEALRENVSVGRSEPGADERERLRPHGSKRRR